MLLKMMGPWALPDHDSRQTFRMVANVAAVHFDRWRASETEEWSADASVIFENGDTERYLLNGNAYLMNNDGKTVAMFAKAAPPDEAWDYQFHTDDPPAAAQSQVASTEIA